MKIGGCVCKEEGTAGVDGQPAQCIFYGAQSLARLLPFLPVGNIVLRLEN